MSDPWRPSVSEFKPIERGGRVRWECPLCFAKGSTSWRSDHAHRYHDQCRHCGRWFLKIQLHWNRAHDGHHR